MIRAAFLVNALLALGACGENGPSPSPSLSPTMISNPMVYLAQSRSCDGNVETPLRDTDTISCRRFDFGHYQASESFLTAAGAITTWSYNPWGPFSVQPDGYGAHGDGGEQYVLRGGGVQITHTQDGGKPGVQILLPKWTVLTTRTGRCEDGWTRYNDRERGCLTVVNYPSIGPVDTVISEHGDDNAVERILLAKGWGRLAWMAFSKLVPVADLAMRCPDFGQIAPPTNHPDLRLTDCRITTNIEPTAADLTGAQLWAPR